MLSLLLALACRPDDDDPSSAPVDATGASHTAATAPTGDTAATPLTLTRADLLPPADANLYLASRWVVASDEPTLATLWIDDGEQRRRIAFTERAVEHELPVLGLLAGVEHTLSVTLTADDGREATTTATITPAPPPVLLPRAAVLASDPARTEPGWTLAGLQSPGLIDLIAVFDEAGRPRFVRTTVGDIKAARLDEQGRLTYKIDQALTTMDILGRERLVYSPTDLGPGTVLVDVSLFHHDVRRQPDGSLFSLVKSTRRVDEFPTDYTMTSYAPADVIDDLIVHLAADGTLLGSWSSVDLLDPRRIGWDSLEPSPLGEVDWGHTNAVEYDPVDDDILISLRHQDAVVRFDRATGAVSWILGHPGGWSAELEALRLQPIGDLRWPYHQHAPQLDGDLLTLFDNGNNQRTSPYNRDNDPLGNYSRVVQYQIDEAARTVEEVFSFEARQGPNALFASSLGNADRLPSTSNILATFGTLGVEEDGANPDQGRGDSTVRLIEVAVPSGDRVWELSLWSDLAEAPRGWRCDQATRVPSLYQGIAVETVE
jgi:arylsulfate sulfotransferase